jgi:hypothetical protein
MSERLRPLLSRLGEISRDDLQELLDSHGMGIKQRDRRRILEERDRRDAMIYPKRYLVVNTMDIESWHVLVPASKRRRLI